MAEIIQNVISHNLRRTTFLMGDFIGSGLREYSKQPKFGLTQEFVVLLVRMHFVVCLFVCYNLFVCLFVLQAI